MVDYGNEKIEKLNTENDAVIWTVKKNISILNKPDSYEWVDIDSTGNTISISCKS